MCFRNGAVFFCSVRLGRGDIKDFLSLSKKVLVTLICVICSFFSTARRTNQEAPPQLSGFWVCRRSRRRGLRNSLRSDSPRPFSSVFLATSPPDKGGIGGSCLYSNPPLLLSLRVFLTPPSFGHLPYILRCKNTPQCCGTRQGESVRFDFVTVAVFLTPPSFGHLPYILLCKNTP